MTDSADTALLDLHPSRQTFIDDVVTGLAASPKRLPCKYFYDQRGSALFDKICQLDEYYLTRTETAIMRSSAAEMGRQLGERVMLVEYGSGSSIKTQLLLDNLTDPAAYVPVDISRKHLVGVAARLSEDYPQLEILPVAADFTKDFRLPTPTKAADHAAVYFPGSTIGNFPQQEAESLLQSIARVCGRGGGLLIGIDLVKEPETLELAYDDPAGVTAEFNLNLLRRMRGELDASIDLDGFEHFSFYNPEQSRVEIYIRSLRDQAVSVAGQRFEFRAGELIHTEYSHKYTVEGFAEIAARAGLILRKSWTDERNYFAVLHLKHTD